MAPSLAISSKTLSLSGLQQPVRGRVAEEQADGASAALADPVPHHLGRRRVRGR
jgi:hypothetical protein